ncbi:T9SS type A sorting domain-containing protein, partial [Candidatus Poribacteria bacterium]|nr:T9SS type A sorting domain-containing protein [Candidatus Poribacteria bacterium]
WDVATGTRKITISGHLLGIRCLSFSPDGAVLASGSSNGPLRIDTARLWDVATDTLKLKSTLEGDYWVSSLSFSPDGTILASGIWETGVGISEGKVRLWDVATGTLKSELPGHVGDVHSVSFSPDGLTLASGGQDETVRLWDVATGTVKATFTEHTTAVYSVLFSPDGTTLASVDERVRLWDVATGAVKFTSTFTGAGRVLFKPDGLTLASYGEGGTVLLWDFRLAPSEPPRLAADVNDDGVVNIQDLVAVAAAFGETGETPADVNGDGQVNIQDLVAVAASFGEVAAGAPSAANLSTETVQHWLSAAKQLNLTDTTSQRGIRLLEQLLLMLTPKETALLANYPNPFNPETWIPYQLANPADVTLRIYTIDGSLVRMLSLGHKGIGMYQSRSRAAYWDGKNEIGEPVASGVYFYTLTAGDFTATRKMLIRK